MGLDWPRATVLTAALLLIAVAGFTQNTELISANEGVGFDGQSYARLTAAFREGTQTEPLRPFAYRVLPSAVVALTGLDVRAGFLVLDILCYAGAALLLLVLLRDHAVPPARALLAAGWWILLPHGVRYSLHYPVLTDAAAILLTIGLLLAAFRRRLLLFAVLLTLAVATRESLVLFAPLPFLLLRHELGPRRAIGIAALAAVPALVTIALLQLAPPVEPHPLSSPSSAHVRLQIQRLLSNDNAVLIRTVVALPFALGALIVPILGSPRAAWRFASRRPAWTYLIGTILVTSALGGGDMDRYLLTLSPIVAVIAFAATPAGPWQKPWSVVALTVVHILMTRAWYGWGADRLVSFSIGFMRAEELVVWTVYALALLLVGVVVYRTTLRPRGPWTRRTSRGT